MNLSSRERAILVRLCVEAIALMVKEPKGELNLGEMTVDYSEIKTIIFGLMKA